MHVRLLLRLLLGGFLLFLAGLLAWWYFFASQPDVQKVVRTADSEVEAKFTFDSEIPGIQIAEPINDDLLYEILSAANYQSGKPLVLPKIGTTTPDLTRIVFRDIGQVQTPANLWNTEAGRDSVTAGIDFHHDLRSNTLTYYIYIFPDDARADLEAGAYSWSWQVARLFHGISNSNPTIPERTDFRERANDLIYSQQPLFSLRNTQQSLEVMDTLDSLLAGLFGSFDSPQVTHAQNCTGYRECGHVFSVHTCSGSQDCAGTPAICSQTGERCSWSAGCENGSPAPGGCAGGGASCNNYSCPEGTCSDGMVNTCRPESPPTSTCPSGPVVSSYA